MSLLHSSTRRPPPLKDTDYDHEIRLIDHTQTASPRRRSHSPSASERQVSPGVSDSSSRRHSDVPLRKHTSLGLRQEITRRKYSKYQDRHLENPLQDDQEDAAAADEDDIQHNGPAEERGRTRDGGIPDQSKDRKTNDSVIDVLYENQRGGFLCGIPLFSGAALGNLDPSPWTNVALKTSATNITNAQVPDPSWEWAWKEWSVNHTDEVDEDGWEYSFAFSKKFSWHSPTWWNSFVRRRAWIRKRVKKNAQYHVSEAHTLNSDYFTIHSAQARSRSRASTMDVDLRKRYSIVQLAKREMDDNIVVEHIADIGSLMNALKFARIDREKMEAVESFIQHGGEELYYLRDRMHDIMGMFIFQASRRLLLTHLIKIFNEASEQQKAEIDNEKNEDSTKKRQYDNLQAAVKHAEEEVRKLEFWSDVKDMAEKGETKGAVDESQGWDSRWTGLDHSGPKDVISNRDITGIDDCKEGEGNGTAISSNLGKDKGKGKDK